MFHHACKLIIYNKHSSRVLQNFKNKMVGAKKGYDLLKKKSDALKKEFNEIMKKLVMVKKRMGKDFNEC